MTPISDEQLAAYLDGELAPEARQAVEAAVDADPALAERLAALAAGDQALRAGFSAISDEPVPERLLRALEPARKPAESAPARRLARRRVPRLGLAIAATLMVGAVTALLWPAAGPAPAMTPLQLALEQQLSGEPLVVRNADGTTTDVQVLRTVQRGDGTVCRAYEHTALAAGEVVSQHTGLACRTGQSGDWPVGQATVRPPGCACPMRGHRRLITVATTPWPVPTARRASPCPSAKSKP